MSAEQPAPKITMFRARDSSWKQQLSRVEVDRMTVSSIWINGCRVARSTEETQICEDFESAKQWLRIRLGQRITRLEEELGKLRNRLTTVTATKEDEILTNNDLY
jgi:hypothetical protein